MGVHFSKIQPLDTIVMLNLHPLTTSQWGSRFFILGKKIHVMAILACQFDYIWNYPKPKQLGIVDERLFFLIKSHEVG